MDRFFMAHSRAISIVTCCSMGWLAYACFIRSNHSPFRQSLEAVLKRARKRSSSVIVAVQPDLEYLSIDVLLEIMALLEWDDVLRLRQVSKRLNLATCHRTIWYNLLKPSPARFTLRKEIQRCSSEDLEGAYLRVQLAHRRWVKPIDSVPRRVELFHDQDFLWPTTLLPGGRWLLTLNTKHELLYMDVDTPAAIWCSLVPPAIDCDACDGWSHALTSLTSLIDVDLDADYLTFNIVIMSLFNPGREQRYWPTRFHIWRVTTNFDDKGCAVGLKATQLSAFEEKEIEHLEWKHIHLRGDFVAYHGQFPVVVNWKMANGYSDKLPRYCIRTGCDGVGWLYILPKKQVIFGGGGYYNWVVEGWGSLSPTTEIPTSSALGHPSVSESEHDDSMPVLRKSDPPFICGNSVSFISHTLDDGVYGIVRSSFDLPDPAAPAAFLVKEDVLYTQPAPWIRYTFMSTCGLLVGNDTIITTNHVSPEGTLSAFDIFSWGDVFPCGSTPATDFMVDEISRRCIFTYQSDFKHYIVEF